MMSPFDSHMYALAETRAKRVGATLAALYDAPNGLYRTSPDMALFRDVPHQVNFCDDTRQMRTLLSELLPPSTSDFRLELLRALPTDPDRYHARLHAMLTAIISKRLAAIYLPHHPEVAAITVVAALLHDAHHTHEGNDFDNITRATQFVRMLISVYEGDCGLLGTYEVAEVVDMIATIIRCTRFERGTFTSPLPDVAPVECAPDSSHIHLVRMATRIVGEADLMMSATTSWPVLATALALDASRSGNHDFLDLPTFAAKQYTFAKDQIESRRIKLPETIAALRVVMEIHSSI